MKEEKKKNETTTKVEKETEQEVKKEVKVDKNKELIEKLTAEANEYKDKWMRSVAEFDNYKKRNAEAYSKAYNEGIEDTINKILFVGDTLEWALQLGLDEKNAEGIKKTLDKYNDTLKSMGVVEMNPLGEEFDPNTAEAVMQVPVSEGEKVDTVKQVFQKGYKLKDKIIRYAKVSVIK